jgi:hypothetical protein
MVRQYATKFYMPANENRKSLMEKDWAEAKSFLNMEKKMF